MKPTDKIVNEHDKHTYTVSEIEHSRRIQKAVTPKGDLTWYIKWAASIAVLVAITFRASGVTELYIYDMTLTWLSAVGWFFVGFMWKDRALMLVNGVAGVVLFAGILRFYFGG